MLRFIGNEHRWPEPQAKKTPTHRKLAAVSFYFVAMQGKLNVFTLERVCLTHYHSCEDWSQPSSAFLRELRTLTPTSVVSASPERKLGPALLCAEPRR